MAPFLIGNIASAALGALSGSSDSQDKARKDPFNDLVAKLQQTASGAKTVTKIDGSQVTTVNTANGGERVVSETSANGQTLTEAGYVSPTLVQKFLDNLFSTLKADGAQVAGSAATSAASTAGRAASTSVSSAVDKLGSQLSAGASGTAGLVNSFGSLLQSSGIDLPDGTSVSAALKSFLAHAAPAISSGQITRTGINIRA